MAADDSQGNRITSTDSLLKDLRLRRERSDARVMAECEVVITRLQADIRHRGRLLADIFNHPDLDLPPELERRLGRLLMFGADTELSVPLDGPAQEPNRGRSEAFARVDRVDAGVRP